LRTRRTSPSPGSPVATSGGCSRLAFRAPTGGTGTGGAPPAATPVEPHPGAGEVGGGAAALPGGAHESRWAVSATTRTTPVLGSGAPTLGTEPPDPDATSGGCSRLALGPPTGGPGTGGAPAAATPGVRHLGAGGGGGGAAPPGGTHTSWWGGASWFGPRAAPAPSLSGRPTVVACGVPAVRQSHDRMASIIAARRASID